MSILLERRRSRRSPRAFLISLGVVAALLAPSGAASALPQPSPADGAVALSASVDSSGSLLLEGASLLSEELGFDAGFSGEELLLPAGYAEVQFELLRVDAPDGGSVAIHDASAAPLMGVGGPRLTLNAGESIAASWAFSVAGNYRLAFRAVSVPAPGTQDAAPQSADATVAVQVAPASAPVDPVPEPTASPGPSTPSPPPSTPSPTTTTSPPPTGIPAPTPGDPAEVAPAPEPGVRRVFSKIHTDAVSTYFDNGHIVLATKADVAGQVGQRFDPATVLFNVEPAAKTAPPDGAEFSFLDDGGAPLWIAPQRQDHDIIWPGFSTEDPNLAGKLDGNRVTYTLNDVVGPGFVEIFQTGEFGGAKRLFSSRDEAFSSTVWNVPVHAHANWAFSKQGRYEFTFTATARVGGEVQSAKNRYVFYVGDIATLTQKTELTMTTSTTLARPGAPVTLTATATGARSAAVYQPEGSIEFYHGPETADPKTLDGYRRIATIPAINGKAGFNTAAALGKTSYVSRFVPTWKNEFSGSSSAATVVTVADDIDEVEAPAYSSLIGEPGIGIRITSGQPVFAGDSVRVTAPQRTKGETVAVWLVPNSGAAVWLQWQLLDSAKAFTVNLPSSAPPGNYRLAAKLRTGAIVGWDTVEVKARLDPGPVPPPPGGGQPPPPGPSNPAAPPAAAPPLCAAPTVTFDRGHIDAFNVTARDGQLVLQLKEDVTGSHVLRTPEAVLLKVKEEAYKGSIPVNLPGSPAGYFLPLTQNADLIWPGWDTNATSGSGFTDVTINISSASGPGQVFLYTLAGFGTVSPILEGGGYTFPGSIREAVPAHTHAQWTFSERGVYKLTADAVATNPSTGASIRSAPHTYVIQVGDVPLGDAFCGVNTAEAGVSTASAVGSQTNKEAAAQAAAEEAAADRKRQNSAAETPFSPIVDAFRSGSPAMYGMIAGGVLLIAAIAVGTIRVVRRRSIASADG